MLSPVPLTSRIKLNWGVPGRIRTDYPLDTSIERIAYVCSPDHELCVAGVYRPYQQGPELCHALSAPRYCARHRLSWPEVMAHLSIMNYVLSVFSELCRQLSVTTFLSVSIGLTVPVIPPIGGLGKCCLNGSGKRVRTYD